MANSSLMIFSISFIMVMATMVHHASFSAATTCNQQCKSNDDCDGKLACIRGKCNDDPQVGTTTICRRATPPSSPTPTPGGGGGGGGVCRTSGTLSCGRRKFQQFKCSPPVTSSTKATLTLNDFSKGGDGGSPSECDERFHENSEAVVALSSGWYDGGSRCGKKIRITASNGKSVVAKVVDECDSVNGCDKEHAGLPPCKNNIVDGSAQVWRVLDLDQDKGLVPVTWTMV
ncbi:unnamed protein product [Linum grandiflorum]